MAPAELSLAGAIVLVHNSGGQIEIVDGFAPLLYETPAEAADKILLLCEDEGLRLDARQRLSALHPRFTAEAFTRGISDIVMEALDGETHA
jgi:hypothetical protein